MDAHLDSAPPRAHHVPAGPDLEAQVRAALDAGDVRGALALLIRELGAPIHHYCRRIIGDDTLAEDVRQSVFVSVLEGLARFEPRASIRSWVFSIAHNRCLDVLASRRRFAARFVLRDDLPEHLADAAPSPADRLDARERHRALARCLERIAPPLRAAVLLRYHHGLSYEEMAQLCGERAGTLQARVARTLPRLRRALEVRAR